LLPNLFANALSINVADFPASPLLRADYVETPLGPMIAIADRSALHLLEFTERRALNTELRSLWKRAKGSLGFGRFPLMDKLQTELTRYFRAESANFKTRLALHGSDFTLQVWRALHGIPVGETRHYAQIAETLGRPAATRAVGRANGANPISILVPCHRLIGANGALTGYGGGLWRKQALLDLEHKIASSG